MPWNDTKHAEAFRDLEGDIRDLLRSAKVAFQLANDRAALRSSRPLPSGLE